MQNKKQIISYSEAINDALHYCMSKDKNLLCYGLGVTDPKGVFGTTLNLERKFGKKPAHAELPATYAEILPRTAQPGRQTIGRYVY